MTELLIIFSKIKTSALKGNLTQFSKDVKNSVTVLDDKANDSNTCFEFCNGFVPGQSKKALITVFVASRKLTNNMGMVIVNFKSRLISIFENYGVTLSVNEIDIKINPGFSLAEFMKNHVSEDASGVNPKNESDSEFDFEKRAQQFVPVEPHYTFNRVIIADEIKDKIQEAIGILECEHKVFEEWGLSEIQPHPSTSLSFFGPSGTGKTMAAEAVADKLGKKILKVSYADVESKYHGEGPKMVKAIFYAAEKDDAVLFFDEADSLLSKRLTNVSQGSEQAINSMRSQLLICLEDFKGIVIFATNLVVNYDKAFLTRLISIEFKKPCEAIRQKIWDVHLRPIDDGKEHKLNIPLAKDVDTSYLAKNYKFVGREIRNAVISACVSVALAKRDIVTQDDIVKACDKLNEEKKALTDAQQLSPKAKNLLEDAIKDKISKDSKESEQKKEEDNKEKSNLEEK